MSIRHLETFTRGTAGAYVADGNGYKWSATGSPTTFTDMVTVQPVKPGQLASVAEFARGRESFWVIGSVKKNATTDTAQSDTMVIEGVVYECMSCVPAKNLKSVEHYRALFCNLMPLSSKVES